MRDPHVKSLRYRVLPSEDVTFDQPPALEWDTADFHMILEDSVATFELQRHYPSREAARQAVERYLRAWHIDMALRSGSPELRCEFEAAEIVDRHPPPPGTPQVIYAEAAMAGASALSAKAHITKKQYPDPPKNFAVSKRVDAMCFLFQGYLASHVRLTDMAYSCWTFVKGEDDLLEVAKRYRISRRVLRKLKQLSSAVGTEQTARKALPPDRRRPHTSQEIAWIEAAVKALIRRMGEYAYDPAPAWPRVTMNDLPRLP